MVQLHQSRQFLFSERKTIAEIAVAGAPREMALPARLPVPSRHYPLIRPDEIKTRREATFAAQFPGKQNPLVGLDFMILRPDDVRTMRDGLYEETRVDEYWRVNLGDAEEWTIRVPNVEHGGNEGHPFHIHVNSFEVISAGGRTIPPGTIQDTVWVNKDSDVVIRMKFRQWRGKAVFHCHILPHEDTGMMKNFLIR